MLENIAQYWPKQIRRDVRGTVLCVAGFILIMTIVSSIVIVVGALFEMFSQPEFADLLFNAPADSASISSEITRLLNDPRYTEMITEATYKYSGLASIVGMLCGLPLFFTIRGTRFVREDPVRVHSNMRVSHFVLLLVLILGVQFLMTLIQLSIEPFFNDNGASLTDALEESTSALALSPWGVLYVVLFGPICEELVFRGAVLRKLERYGANFAIIVSSLLFGLYHIILFQAVFAFLIGLVLAYTAGRFSLKWSVLLHIINNGLAVLSIYLASDVFNIALTGVYALSLAITVVVLIITGVRGRLANQLRAGAPSEPRVWTRAITSPWLLAYIVLCVLGGISMVTIL